MLAMLGWSGAWGEERKVSVRAAGVTVIWEQGNKEAFEHMMVLNSQHPVALALYITAKGKKIVAIDSDKSKLTSLGDDQETNIKGRLGHFPRLAKDGSAAFVEIQGENGVSTKAEALVAKGSLAISTASKTDSKRSKVVKAKKGSKLEFGEGLNFEIAQAGKPDFGDDPFAVTLKIKRDIPEVAKFRFFDADGKEIEAHQTGSSRGGGLGNVSVTRDFNLKRKADQIRVEIDRWTDLGKVVVPFDVKVGIGGGK